MRNSFVKITNSIVECWIIYFVLASVAPGVAAPLSEARVSQVIQDVRLLSANAAPRPAAVNDNVRLGSAVRTGTQSRAELTFQDLTITRLGENTVFSLKEGTRDLTLEHGSILLQVPSGAPTANIRTAAVTAAVSGGTAIFGTGPPVKFMVMEGVGTFYPAGHPEDAVTLHGGEMATLGPDGHLIVQTFNVKLVLETSPLITEFPDLANLPLILQVQNQQQTDQNTPSGSPPPSKDIIDVTSENTTANPTVNQTSTSGGTPSGTPSEFGTPPTITTPDPYVISSGTTISTDPTITTNGVTNFGTFYRGPTLDGSPSEFLFGEAPTSFDQMVFQNPGDHVPIAVFKFSDLELTGNPTITIPSGGTTYLALVAVGSITSGGPGGTLTFAGITRLDFITQDGSISLGSEISFSGIDHLTFYARGSGSNLTLASPISGASEVDLHSEGSTQVNGSITVSDNFDVLTGGDFLAGTGLITATNIDIVSLNNININASQFPNPADNSGSVTLNALNTLNLNLDRGGGFGWDSFDASADTINITGSHSFDFSNASGGVTFAAGTGGINASGINFIGSNLTMTSGGDISIGSFVSPSNDQGGNIDGGTINAAGAVNATGNITNTTDLTAGTSVSVGGDLGTNTLTAGTTINVGGQLFADTVTAGGNITANGVGVITINAPMSILTAGSLGIFGEVTDGGAAVQNTFNISSIVSPNGMDFSGNQYDGANGLSSGGLLTINATTITFDSETGIGNTNFNGADSGVSGSGNPANGGDGGTFIVNTTGDITANSGADITATTGLNSAPGVYSGAGGSVTLHSTGGMVTVNDTIQVSSDDSEAPRQSASGGTILLQSDLTTGQGITVGSNGSLLSLLNPNAPGPGGSITLSTMGADIVVNGTVEADSGTITIDQNDPAGPSIPTITVDGATLTSDTVNIYGAGVLNIGLNNPVSINTNELNLEILNELDFGVPATHGGTIAGDSTINVSAPNLSIGGLSVFLLNENDQGGAGTTGGHIDGSASITMNVSGDLTVNGTPSNSGLEPGAANLSVQNYGIGDGSPGGFIGGDAAINLTAGSISTTSDFNVFIPNDTGGYIGGSANISVTAGSMSVDEFAASITNTSFGFNGPSSVAGQIVGAASITFNITGALSIAGGTDNDMDEPSVAAFTIDNSSAGSGSPGGFIGSDASINVSAGSISDGGRALRFQIFNDGGGTIGGSASIAVATTGGISATGPGPTGTGENLILVIDNSSDGFTSAGSIAGAATINLSAATISAGGLFDAEIDNFSGGSIGGDVTIGISTQGLPSNPTLEAAPVGDLTAGSVFVEMNNTSGGQIGGIADVSVNLGGDLITTSGGVTLQISNQGGTIGSDSGIGLSANNINSAANLFEVLSNNGGFINGGAAVNLFANSITTGATDLNVAIDNTGGSITGPASVTVFTSGDINATGNSFFQILNNSAFIGNNATVDVQTANFSTTNQLVVAIDNTGGNVAGDAAVIFNATGNVTAVNSFFQVLNGSSADFQGGIQGSASIDVVAQSFNLSSLTANIENSGGVNSFGGPVGVIEGSASIEVGTTGVLTGAPSAAASPSPGDLTAGSMVVQINNTGGEIDGDATINMDVAGTANIAGDATVQILGNDPFGSAAINFNGGTYNVGGNFRSTIDGNGTINLNSVNVTANTIKVGVFGTNGSLMIGGGSMSANQELKLYATGSSGSIEFTASVTLNCAATAIILAANKITIDQNVVVTIAGSFPASVYATIANYTGFGGNGSTNGTFAGAGASNPQSPGGAPPFDDPPSSSTSSKTTATTASTKVQNASSATAASGTGGGGTRVQNSSSTMVASSSNVSKTSRRGHRSSLADGLKQSAHSGATSANVATTMSNTIKAANSGELLSVLDAATTTSSNGKIMVTSSKGDGVVNTAGRNHPGRPDTASGLSHGRATPENRTSSNAAVALLQRSNPSPR